jgi:hypothetical protein
MKHNYKLTVGLLLLVTISVGVGAVFYSRQQIANLTYNASSGAEQVTIVGRGVTSPQNNALSEAQIASLTYNATLGAKQVYVDAASWPTPLPTPTPVVAYAGTPTANQFLQYNAGFWENRGSLIYPTTSVTQQSYSIASANKSDRYMVNYTSLAPTIHLMTDMLTNGRELQIMDVSGNSDDKPILIDTEGAETIAGENSLTLLSNRAYLSLISNGVGWFVRSVQGIIVKNTNLLANGSFSSDTTSWTGIDGTLASVSGGQSGNCLEITRTGGTIQTAYQTFTTQPGKRYQVTYYVKSGTSGAEAARSTMYDGAMSANPLMFYQLTSTAAWVQRTYYFTAIGRTSTIYLSKNTSTAGTMLFDEIVVNETF